MIKNPEDFMKQDTLANLLQLCTQEEPPKCTSLCPLQVNVKEIISLIQTSNFDKAYKVFRKTIPFTKIISKTCHEPCEKQCERNSLGGAIEIKKLEQSIVNFGYSITKPPMFIPKNNKNVIIIGGGLRGMSCAYYLALKGYNITIYEKYDKLGGRLNELEQSIISEEDITNEINNLLKLPIKVIYNQNIDISTIESINLFKETQKADIVYLSVENNLFWNADKTNLILDNSNIISGSMLNDKNYFTINFIFDGKAAATTIDRTLKNVSVLAGREKELPSPSALYVNTSLIQYKLPINKQEFSIEDAIIESKRCIMCECLECVKGCAFMQEYKSYPKKYTREVYNNLSIAMGIHHANKMTNSCNLCGQCKSICPNGMDMSEVFLTARTLMTNSNKMPPSAFEFALLDMQYSQSDDFFIAKHQNNKTSSKYIYFPSCQLCASEPNLVYKSYDYICNTITGGVGIMLGCCGIMANWAGDSKLFKEHISQIQTELDLLGNPTIITSCPTCLQTFKQFYNINAVGIWDFINTKDLSIKNIKTEKLVVHDACSSRYDDNAIYNIRKTIKSIGYNLEEKHYSKNITSCCGYGGLMPFSNADLSDKVSKNVSNESELPYLTYCINCRDRFIKQGKQSYHFLELVFDGVKINSKYPTWSNRQSNKKSTKNNFLINYYNEKGNKDLDCKLYIDKELEIIIDERMILTSDIQKAIINAIDNNQFLKNIDNNFFITSYQPNNVTFWIKYIPFEDGYKILNAYSHRMTILNRK